jgi:predicted TIM-barrel fold metal-dependent hydrolase
MAKYQPALKLSELVAIDVHTHANLSQRQPPDPCSLILDEAMAKYFKSRKPPTIPEIAQYYRERKLAAVIFTVDHEAEVGHWRIANEEVAEVAAEHSDVLIPFASIDPAKGKMGAREARGHQRLRRAGQVHPRQASTNDRGPCRRGDRRSEGRPCSQRPDGGG